jgi:hypothetical protein
MQRTIELEHEGRHDPTFEEVEAALDAELKSEGLKRSGDFRVTGSTVTSGGPSKFTLTFDADEPPKPGRKPANDDSE